ncbi:unnamed protein product [Prorocentrum cordatum]|uniref:Uncharacterized protein n=1 Tax=Prorocentrum cordatum TaxID=2364126 RepID=A0ABN9SHU0_9DINO|nr:unnamed protein product [Polarella glacialis]
MPSPPTAERPPCGAPVAALGRAGRWGAVALGAAGAALAALLLGPVLRRLRLRQRGASSSDAPPLPARRGHAAGATRRPLRELLGHERRGRWAVLAASGGPEAARAAQLAAHLARIAGPRAAGRAAAASSTSCGALRVPLTALERDQGRAELYVFGGRSNGEVSSAAQVLWPATGVVMMLQPMPTARCGCAAAAAHGRVYAIGGHSSGEDLDCVECFDCGAGCWADIPPPPMPSRRSFCAAAVVDGHIFVIGGAGVCGEELPTAERFSPGPLTQDGFWSTSPSMLHARFAGALASTGGALYACAGYLRGQCLRAAERLDVDAGGLGERWVDLPSMPTARFACASAAVRGAVLVCGGSSGWEPLGTVERFDPVAGAWEVLPARLQIARKWCAAAAVAGDLFVLGGFDGSRCVGQVERPLAGASPSSRPHGPELPDLAVPLECLSAAALCRHVAS